MDIKAIVAKSKLFGVDVDIITDDIIICSNQGQGSGEDTHDIMISSLDKPIRLEGNIEKITSNILGKRYGTLIVASNACSYIIDTFNLEVSKRIRHRIERLVTSYGYNAVYQCSDDYLVFYSETKGKIIDIRKPLPKTLKVGMSLFDNYILSFKEYVDKECEAVTYFYTVDGDVISFEQFNDRLRLKTHRERERYYRKSHGWSN